MTPRERLGLGLVRRMLARLSLAARVQELEAELERARAAEHGARNAALVAELDRARAAHRAQQMEREAVSWRTRAEQAERDAEDLRQLEEQQRDLAAQRARELDVLRERVAVAEAAAGTARDEMVQAQETQRHEREALIALWQRHVGTHFHVAPSGPCLCRWCEFGRALGLVPAADPDPRQGRPGGTDLLGLARDVLRAGPDDLEWRSGDGLYSADAEDPALIATADGAGWGDLRMDRLVQRHNAAHALARALLAAQALREAADRVAACFGWHAGEVRQMVADAEAVASIRGLYASLAAVPPPPPAAPKPDTRWAAGHAPDFSPPAAPEPDPALTVADLRRADGPGPVDVAEALEDLRGLEGGLNSDCVIVEKGERFIVERPAARGNYKVSRPSGATIGFVAPTGKVRRVGNWETYEETAPAAPEVKAADHEPPAGASPLEIVVRRDIKPQNRTHRWRGRRCADCEALMAEAMSAACPGPRGAP